jgi:hypothetical protein
MDPILLVPGEFALLFEMDLCTATDETTGMAGFREALVLVGSAQRGTFPGP